MNYLLPVFSLILSLTSVAQNDSFYLLKPLQVFDGENLHKGWVVLVSGNSIEAAGSMNFKLPSNTRIIELPDIKNLRKNRKYGSGS